MLYALVLILCTAGDDCNAHVPFVFATPHECMATLADFRTVPSRTLSHAYCEVQAESD